VCRTEERRACVRTSKQIPEPEHWEKPIPAMILTRVSSQFGGKKEWTESLKTDIHEDLACECEVKGSAV
jgi:hypothetical protein